MVFPPSSAILFEGVLLTLYLHATYRQKIDTAAYTVRLLIKITRKRLVNRFSICLNIYSWIHTCKHFETGMNSYKDNIFFNWIALWSNKKLQKWLSCDFLRNSNMPYLYAGPDDKLCMLRGVHEKDGEKPLQAFWDGSKDRWVSHVSTRVSPDAVSTLLHTTPVDAPIPPAMLKQEAEDSCRQYSIL